MIVESDGFRIDFTDAIWVSKFDETDKSKMTYHGVTALKAVDIIAELQTAYILVEIKDYAEPHEFDEFSGINESDRKDRHHKFNFLKNYLKQKFRDSYLYREAENKVDKPIHYLCLLNLDNALNNKMAKTLKTELPVGKVSGRWKKKLAESCQVIHLNAWNRNFPKWPAQKITNSD
jgi:hypothetical protein